MHGKPMNSIKYPETKLINIRLTIYKKSNAYQQKFDFRYDADLASTYIANAESE